MLLGLLWYIWDKKDLKLAEELFEAGERDSWVMGEGDISRIYFTPSLQATLAEIIKSLGGKDHSAYRNMPRVWSKKLKGYQAHLQVLHIALLGFIKGGITEKMAEALEHEMKRQPRNPLFKAVASRFILFENSIAQEVFDLYPSNRLPTSKDWYTEWLPMRDYGTDWMPAPRPRTHSGGDYLFIVNILTRKRDNG
jgi:hypothetical protein